MKEVFDYGTNPDSADAKTDLCLNCSQMAICRLPHLKLDIVFVLCLIII